MLRLQTYQVRPIVQQPGATQQLPVETYQLHRPHLSKIHPLLMPFALRKMSKQLKLRLNQRENLQDLQQYSQFPLEMD